MKKIFSCMLILAFLLSCALPAHAETPGLSEKLFKYAKNALSCLASGEFDKVVTSLPFSDISPSADEWRNFAQGSFSSLFGVTPQSKYAVAYWNGRAWMLAVPVSEPNSGSVEALILTSEDGSTFTGYGCAVWANVKREYEASPYVVWDEEYSASTSVIVAFDQ